MKDELLWIKVLKYIKSHPGATMQEILDIVPEEKRRAIKSRVYNANSMDILLTRGETHGKVYALHEVLGVHQLEYLEKKNKGLLNNA